MKYFLLALSAICIMAASCKKVETPESKAEKLRDSKWVPYSAVITYYDYMGGDSVSNTVWTKKDENGEDKRPECIKDDFLQFNQNFDGSHITGGVKCQTSETDDIAFKWGLSDNDKKMYIYGLYSLLGQDANGLLYELTDDKFVFVYPKQIQDGNQKDITVKYTMTFTKK